jgi:copper resistance protein D
MALMIDVFGFLSVLLRGFALALTAVSIGGVVFRHAVLTAVLKPALSRGGSLERLASIQWSSAVALVIVTVISKTLDVSILISTIGVSWVSALTAPFVLAGFAIGVAGILLAVAARSGPWLLSEVIGASILLGSIVVTTHATGRLADRDLLVAFSALHQAGGAAWIGGLPYFLVMLGIALPA